MAEELDLALDLDPVNVGGIAVYPLDESGGYTTLVEIPHVETISPREGSDRRRVYQVTVEFQPGEYGLDVPLTVGQYFRSFESARVTQEALANRVREDLMEALELDDVFVHVEREHVDDKATIIGKP